MLVCIKSALLCFPATAVPETFQSLTVALNSYTERDTITHCSDEMHYGELHALHTEEKCAHTVCVCVCATPSRGRKESYVRADWLASLSRVVLPLIKSQGQT